MTIRQAKKEDIKTVAKLAGMMWDHHELEELEEEFSEVIGGAESVVFLISEGMKAIGFAQCQLRHDYVEGTSSSPVGYLEGIFIQQGYRKNGYAYELLQCCEQWAREQGCVEFASDCELSNDTSLHFHLAVGFQEANRIICFTKKL